MASKAIRRPCTVDIDKTSEKHMETAIPDSIREPLLGSSPHENKPKRYEPNRRPDFWDGQRQECVHWVHLLSTFIVQSSRHIVNVISEFGSFLSRLFGYSSVPHSSQNGQTVLVDLSPLQMLSCVLKKEPRDSSSLNFYPFKKEERLRFLRQRLDVPFDCSSIKHQDALKELWRLAYPNRQLPPLKSDLWKEMGWQNSDPSTDFRAGGFMSLENLIYFARNYPDSFHRLLHKTDGKRAEWEYPFAVAGVNISYMLAQMLDLQSVEVNAMIGNMSAKAGVCFVQLLEDDEMAFDNLFCVAFRMLDSQWLARRASYMEFNEVLKSTRVQLEQELTIGGISSVHNMPSFRMLKR